MLINYLNSNKVIKNIINNNIQMIAIIKYFFKIDLFALLNGDISVIRRL